MIVVLDLRKINTENVKVEGEVPERVMSKLYTRTRVVDEN